MLGYTRIPSESLRDSYTRAMDEIERDGTDENVKSTSIEAYFESEPPLK
jgi:hypothetical protein